MWSCGRTWSHVVACGRMWWRRGGGAFSPPSTVARKASAEASRRVTRAQPQEGWSAWPREISSSDRGDCAKGGGRG
eukprot:5933216-Prymnesium_polylepis.2